MPRALEEAILDIGVKHVNFFEGRILTGRDLRDQQGAEGEQRKQLGQAIGDGVVEGYRVTIANAGSDAASPILHIDKGLALNRAGQTLLLPQPEDILLVRSNAAATADTGLFHACATQPPGTALPNGSGFYILTVGPASGYQGEAPKSGLGDSGKGAGCGSRYATQGLRFRLLRFDPSTLSAVPATVKTQIATLVAATSGVASLGNATVRLRNLTLLRNLVANTLLGAGPTAQFALNPLGFGTPGTESPLDPLNDLRGSLETNLTSCEVPLTVLYWTINGVEFLDAWAVRRFVRQTWDPASLSLPIGFGLERLLQFHEQVAALNVPAFQPGGIRVEQYFRFLPPAAFFPAVGPGSALGMRTNIFLATYNTGQITDMPAGTAAEILQRSFLYPSTDLQTNPFLQQYSLTENKNAAAAGTTSQSHILFVDRTMNCAASRDGVWETLSTAWDVYRGLVRRRAFLPLGATPVESAARIAIVEAIRDVLDLANRYSSLAGGWTLDKPNGLTAFQSFYGVQKDFATLLVSGLTSVPDTQNRAQFATGLDLRLEAGISGIPGLAVSASASNLVLAVRAQDEINRWVGTWSDSGIAVGPYVVEELLPHPDGLTLVPGAKRPFRYRFLLKNGTDRRLRFALNAETEAATGSWADATTIHSPNGNEITFVEIDSNASAEFHAYIQVPDDAKQGQPALLTVEASAPPPTSTSYSTTLSLPVGSATTPPVTRSLKFDSVIRGPLVISKQAGSSVRAVVSFVYTAPQGPPVIATDFLVELRTPAGAEVHEDWNVLLGKLDVTRTGSVFRATIPNVQRNVPIEQPMQIVIGPAGTAVELRARVVSSGVVPKFEDIHPSVIRITAT